MRHFCLKRYKTRCTLVKRERFSIKSEDPQRDLEALRDKTGWHSRTHQDFLIGVPDVLEDLKNEIHA